MPCHAMPCEHHLQAKNGLQMVLPYGEEFRQVLHQIVKVFARLNDLHSPVDLGGDNVSGDTGADATQNVIGEQPKCAFR